MASDPDVRYLKVTMDSEDMMKKLSSTQSQLQVAMGVTKDNLITFDTIWQSIMLAPVTVIQWKPVYGFNWTESVVDDGVSVTAGGEWKQCNIGQVVDIDEEGYFVDSDATGDPQLMTIGKNNYQAQAKNGVHILIGIQNEAGEFHIIYIDPKGTGQGVSAAFQPSDRLQWWYESGSMRASMIVTTTPPKGEADFSQPDQYTQTRKKEPHFFVDQATWVTYAIR